MNRFQCKLALISPWNTEQGHERWTSGARKSTVKVTGGLSYIWKPGGDLILDPLSPVYRCNERRGVPSTSWLSVIQCVLRDLAYSIWFPKKLVPELLDC